MTPKMRTAAAVVVAVLLIGVGVPFVAGVHGGDGGGNATVEPGTRLAGVVAVERTDIESEVTTRTYRQRLERADSPNRSAAIVESKVDALRERLAALGDRRDRLAARYENGSISAGRYRAELAQLTARVAAVKQQLNVSARVARSVPPAARAAAGLNVSAIQRLRTRANKVSGPVVAKLARSITGRANPPGAPATPARNRTRGPGQAGPPNGTGPGDAGPPNGTGPADGADSGQAGPPNGTGSGDAGPPNGTQTSGPPNGSEAGGPANGTGAATTGSSNRTGSGSERTPSERRAARDAGSGGSADEGSARNGTADGEAASGLSAEEAAGNGTARQVEDVEKRGGAGDENGVGGRSEPARPTDDSESDRGDESGQGSQPDRSGQSDGTGASEPGSGAPSSSGSAAAQDHSFVPATHD